MRYILSPYWNTLNSTTLERQALVFDRLGHRVIQCDTTGIDTGRWMAEMLAEMAPDDVVLFVDCETLALSASLIERAFGSAEAGHVFAVATAVDAGDVFASPAFLCISQLTWQALGTPSLIHDDPRLTAYGLTTAAAVHGVRLELIYPNMVLVPQRPLGGQGCVGIGMFYEEGAVFSLNSPRTAVYAVGLGILQQVAEATMAGRAVDYVGLYRQIHRPGVLPAGT